MTVIGLDDTDSRTRGMCTTYAAALLADAVRGTGGTVERLLLVRLNPAVAYKTRGNAALAVHCDLPADEALELATDLVERHAETADPRTNPGVVVVADHEPDWTRELARRAIREHVDHERVRDRLREDGIRHRGWGNGRGLVGATAAVGAWRGLRGAEWPADWTCECISYRERDRWGTPRDVNHESVFAAADGAYPVVWDTVDRGEGEAVCVPNTPGPVLHGIRGDDREAVESVAAAIESEPVARRATFVTNQGTDQHLREGTVDGVQDRCAYRVTGTVVDPPETRQGGHVFLTVADEGETLQCAAFEPTKRFRERVRALRAGDRVTVCGEVKEGTLKLEKFAVRGLETTKLATPDCPECERSMESAGRNAGYRCRDCGTHADGKVEQSLDRELERGWYEVPPCARRHIAKPLVRGGFDAPTHPER